MRWFGTTWGAPVNHPDYEIPIPLNEECNYCSILFDSESQGVQVPHADDEGMDDYHRVCFNKLVLGPGMAEFIERTRSGQAGQEQQEAGHGRAEQSA